MKENPLVTSLIKEKIFKTDLRLAFFGEIDLTNCYIMEVTHILPNNKFFIKAILYNIIEKLTDIMSIVAQAEIKLAEEDLNEIDILIKKYKKDNLHEFILPGKNIISTKVHIIRAEVRKCELLYAHVYEDNLCRDDFVFEYLNKLSLFFYMLAIYLDE